MAKVEAQEFDKLATGILGCLYGGNLSDLAIGTIQTCHLKLRDLNDHGPFLQDGEQRMHQLYVQLGWVVQKLSNPDHRSLRKREITRALYLHKMLICRDPNECTEYPRHGTRYYPATSRAKYRLLKLLLAHWLKGGKKGMDDMLAQFMESNLQHQDLLDIHRDHLDAVQHEQGLVTGSREAITHACYLFGKLLIQGLRNHDGPGVFQSKGIDGRLLRELGSGIKLVVPEQYDSWKRDLVDTSILLWSSRASSRFKTLPPETDFETRLFWASNEIFGSTTSYQLVRSNYSSRFKRAFQALFPPHELAELLGTYGKHDDLMRCAVMSLVVLPRGRSEHFYFSPEYQILVMLSGEIEGMIDEELAMPKAEFENATATATETKTETSESEADSEPTVVLEAYKRFCQFLRVQVYYINYRRHDFDDAGALIGQILVKHIKLVRGHPLFNVPLASLQETARMLRQSMLPSVLRLEW